jgi:acyl-CoA carboxylase epsilon subunit
MENEESPGQPGPLFFRVVQGEPTHAEIAALAAALTAKRAAAARQADPGTAPGGGWARRADLLRAPLAPGRDAWRRSLRTGPLR